MQIFNGIQFAKVDIFSLFYENSYENPTRYHLHLLPFACPSNSASNILPTRLSLTFFINQNNESINFHKE